MKRTPMLPRNPAFPSFGPTTFAFVASTFPSPLWLDSDVARINTRINTQVWPVCQDWSNSYVRPKAAIPKEAACGARGGDPPADHRERRRAAWDRRPRLHLDEGGRR